MRRFLVRDHIKINKIQMLEIYITIILIIIITLITFPLPRFSEFGLSNLTVSLSK